MWKYLQILSVKMTLGVKNEDCLHPVLSFESKSGEASEKLDFNKLFLSFSGHSEKQLV